MLFECTRREGERQRRRERERARDCVYTENYTVEIREGNQNNNGVEMYIHYGIIVVE